MFQEDFDCETRCGECQVVLQSHADCQVTTKFRRGWPASLRYLRYCKFCKLDHLITYQRGDHQVLQRCLLDVSDLNYGSIPQFTGFVLDSSDGARLCCDQIDAGQYSRQGCFPFTDKPSSTWPFRLIGYEDHHLVEINKKQDFLLYLVAVPEIGEETPLKCWKWSETLEYHPSGGCTCAASQPVEEDLAEFPFPSEICQLPTANDRKYLIRLADLSLGTPEAVIIPPGFTQGSH